MPNPIRVLFTIPNFIGAGSQLEMLRLIEGLDRSLFDPGIAVLKRGGALIEEIERKGIPLLELPFTVPAAPKLTLLSRCREAARVIRPHGFELWHSYHYSDDYTEPIIAQMAGARGWIYTKKNMSWTGRAWKVRTMLASRIIARNTRMMRDFFEQPWFRSKTLLIPAGVDVSNYSPEIAPLGMRAQLGIPEDAFAVAVVAHMVRVKGHPTLIRAASSLPAVHLLFAGALTDEAYVAELRALAAELGMSERVHFLGPVRQIAALLRETEAFALPTYASGRGEGFGVALIEAMSCGIPCIATAIDGPRDIIEDGRSGLLVEPENVASLSEAIRKLAGDSELRGRLGRGARERVLKEYTIGTEVRRTEAVYREVLDVA